VAEERRQGKLGFSRWRAGPSPHGHTGLVLSPKAPAGSIQFSTMIGAS
jgi:hypothetical protein